jgi:non-ribosomal peptide synthetase component F
MADKTAEAFISTTTWAPVCGADRTAWKFYKTGDLVRQCLDGTLMFIGRKDTQVKGKPYTSTVFLYLEFIILHDP